MIKIINIIILLYTNIINHNYYYFYHKSHFKGGQMGQVSKGVEKRGRSELQINIIIIVTEK